MEAVDEAREAQVRPVLPSMRWLLVAFGVLTFLAVAALFIRPDTTDRYFAWTITPPLSAAFLGAAYAAGCTLVVLSLRSTAWAHARSSMLTILLFTLLTLVATLLHVDRFHFGDDQAFARAAAYLWMAVYVLVPLVMVGLLVVQERAPGVHPPRERPMPSWLAAAIAVEGAVMGVVGALLFLAPDVLAGAWPWKLSALTSRAIGAWLVSFGLAAALALRERDLGRLRTPAIAYLVFGLCELLVVLRFAGDLSWSRPTTVLYTLFAAAVALTGALGWREASRVTARAPERQGQPT